MRLHKVLCLLSLLSILTILSSCGYSGIGTIPRGTPDIGNGTLAVIPTVTPDPQPMLTAPPMAIGTNYAFVRKNQLWMALHGGNPTQVTHFDYTNLPNVFWHQPLWSSNDHFIAFIMNAQPIGIGGGGCPGPDYSANGALYIADTTSGQLTKIVVLGDSADAIANSPLNGYWQYLFWQDSTHLLAWYNGVTGKASAAAGLYQYDLNSKLLTQVIPLRSLGIATLFTVQAGLPLLLSMRYSSGQLFYQVVVHPFEQQSQFVIYRRSVVQPELPTSKVLIAGQEAWCASPLGGPFVKPGWDVAQDGEQLVAQMLVEIDTDTNQGSGAIQALNLNDGSMTALFTQASVEMLGHDVTLTYGPDSQTVVVSAIHVSGQNGPYSATLANPAATQPYLPHLAGPIAWRSDSSAFVLQSSDTGDQTAASDVYLFVTGDPHGRLLLTDARDFVWG